MAAFGAATFDQRPARTVAHAAAKAVLAFSAAIVWLIRTLHSEVVPGWGSRDASMESRNGDILGIRPPNRHRERDPRKVQRGREIHNSVESRESTARELPLERVENHSNPYAPRVTGRLIGAVSSRVLSLLAFLMCGEVLTYARKRSSGGSPHFLPGAR